MSLQEQIDELTALVKAQSAQIQHLLSEIETLKLRHDVDKHILEQSFDAKLDTVRDTLTKIVGFTKAVNNG